MTALFKAPGKVKSKIAGADPIARQLEPAHDKLSSMQDPLSRKVLRSRAASDMGLDTVGPFSATGNKKTNLGS